MYYGNHSRRDAESISWCIESTEADSDDVSDVGDVDNDKDIDPDSGDATIDPDHPTLNLPDPEYFLKGPKSDDEEIDEDDDIEQEVKEEDNIQIDGEECEDEMEPQYKRKKTH